MIKNIKRNKIKKIREKMIENEEYNTNEMIPPSLFKINNFVIDLDSVISLSIKSGQYIQFITVTNDRDFTISINDLNIIEDTEELKSNSEYKVVTDVFSHPYYNPSTSEEKLSKYEEIEKLYNQLLKWKGLRKLYLTAGIKARIHDYSLHSLIKDIKFIDVERDVCNKLHQQIYKVRTNSIYGISGLNNKQKEIKNK